MKFKNIGLSLLVTSTMIVGLVGCGGGGSGSSSNDGTSTGVFIDSPVNGLHYITATQDGYTNNKGEFKYKAGEQVEFFLNTLSLGKIDASSLITPYTMAGDTDISNPSKKASNIALLLQNFDADRSNGDMIDVSKFKDLGVYDLSYINLNTTTNAMEIEIAGLLATGGFQQYVDDTNLTPLDTATVNSIMKTYVQKAAQKNNSVSNIIGKSYVAIKCSGLIGCQEDGKISFTATGGTYIDDDETDTFTYEIIDGTNMIKMPDDEEDSGYWYIDFKNTNSNVVTTCEGSTQAKAEACSESMFFVAPSSKASFIASKNAGSDILEKTLVTDFTEIKNKLFYKPYHYASGVGFGLHAFRIENNNTISSGYMSGISDLSSAVLNTWSESGYPQYAVNLTASFLNNKLIVQGTTDGGAENYNETQFVHRYNLENKILSVKDLGNESILDDSYLRNNFTSESVSFNKGNLYCNILWTECRLDKDAIGILHQALSATGK